MAFVCRRLLWQTRKYITVCSRGMLSKEIPPHPSPKYLVHNIRDASCSASITRLKKPVYPRLYKARLVQPDGSTFVVRYSEPRKLIFVPIDPNTLTEEEKKARLKRLKPEKPKKIYQMKGDAEDFNQRSWTDLIRKR